MLPAVDGPTHAYIGGSPSCWALFGELLAREYSDARLMKVHQLTVDTYAVQHPGKCEPRAQRSVWGHLASLYLQLECDVPQQVARAAIAKVTARADALGCLEPPAAKGEMTVADVIRTDGVEAHHAAVRRWAMSVWGSWAPHHPRIAEAAEEAARTS